jgi:hypothetical protein
MHATRVPLQPIPATGGLTPPRSTPVALYSNRKMDKPCARARCCHIARTYLTVAHANDWPLCGCATASSMFYAWGRPWCALPKHRFFEKQAASQVICYKSYNVTNDSGPNRFNLVTFNAFNFSVSAYPARSNRPSLCQRRWWFQLSLPCKCARHPDRNEDRAADLTRYPRA